MPKKETGIYGMNGKPMMKGKMPPKGMPPKKMMHEMPGGHMMADKDMPMKGKKKK